MHFESILFVGGDDVDGVGPPDSFADLQLDRVLSVLAEGRERYVLEPFFHAPLHEVGAIRYRHEVLRDLEAPEIQVPVTRFAGAMDRVRERLELVGKLHHRLQKQAWLLDAAEVYCAAVRALADTLEPRSPGLRALREYLTAHVASEPFAALAGEAAAVKAGLAGVRYALLIQGSKVTVTHAQDEPDYGAEVIAAFAKFQQGAATSYLAKLPEYAEIDHVEGQVLDRVARLHPAEFGALNAFCADHADFVDTTVGRFDREVRFCLAYLELVERLRANGLPFCYPRVSASSKTIAVDDTFDLALATRTTDVVTNDFRLDGDERIFVVTGPNNGGKTTFARTFGQLHHLASLGLLVPGREARLFLPDRIYTHFEREEDVETLRGKFEDELVRVHAILEHATAGSVIVMNESFSSTSLQDALFVGTEVLKRILQLDALGVYVTFVDELATLSEATVSMVSEIDADNPAARTFKVVRKRADGLAYAWAIAEKHGLTYERLRERIAA